MSKDLVVAIEGAVRGGSLALVGDGEVVAKWHSGADIARSEELLARIDDLLRDSGRHAGDLTKVAVSTGPGSFTGIRVALATGIGLARALNIQCIGVSLLKAMAGHLETSHNSTSIVPIGRQGYSWQTFSSHAVSIDAGSGKLEQFAAGFTPGLHGSIVAQSDAFLAIHEIDFLRGTEVMIYDVGRDLAALIAFASKGEGDGLQPFYAGEIPAVTQADR